MKGVAYQIIVFLVGLFGFAYFFIIIDGFRSTLFSTATNVVTDANLSNTITIVNNVIIALPFIALIIAGIWMWTRAQKRGLGEFQQV